VTRTDGVATEGVTETDHDATAPAVIDAVPASAEGRRDTGHMVRRGLRTVTPPLLFAVLVLVLWEAFVYVTAVSALLLPAPSDIGASLVANAGLLAGNALVTLGEILVGFALGAVAGIALGIVVSYSRVFERSAYPWLVASQMVPIVAVAPILVVWFGFTLVPKVLVVALVCFFPVVVNTVDGLRSVDPRMIDLMRTLGASRVKVMRTVRIPSSMPFIFSGLRIAMALAVVGAVFGEWVGSDSGLGYLMLAFNNRLATADLFAAVIVLSAMGIALFFLVGGIERLVIPWHHDGRATGR
jgi:ABC-type nitrate/sulfonate/bicarbonate transport system permease component